MENSRIIELIAKKAGRDANPEELEELSALLGTNPGYAFFNEIVHSLKGNADHIELTTPREEVVNHGWQDLSGKLNRDSYDGSPFGSFSAEDAFSAEGVMAGKPERGRGLFSAGRRWMSVAAGLLLLISGAAFYFVRASGRLSRGGEAGSKILVTSAGFGMTKLLVLSDGTKVKLNAGSRLTYPEFFPDLKREVSLEGEAYFEVAKDTKAPFSVHAGKLTVDVLGTCFNLKAYEDDANFETTLISGKIQVLLDDYPEKNIVLSPHEKLTVTNSLVSGKQAETAVMGVKAAVVAKRGVPKQVYNAFRYQVQFLPRDSGNSFAETAWLTDRLEVSNESFEAVGRILERKYNVHVRFESELLRKEHISGVFGKEDIGKILSILKMTTRFNYRMSGDTVYLSAGQKPATGNALTVTFINPKQQPGKQEK
ncbi:MAG: DUF4974 domain-containing protein [Puia sp.]|nr:DUF4974 domain-containing protein [Puia sp.]